MQKESTKASPKASHKNKKGDQVHDSSAGEERFGFEDEHDPQSAVHLAAASVPASLLDDSDEDFPPAPPALNVSHSDRIDRELVSSPTVPHSEAIDDDVEDTDLGAGGKHVSKQTQVLDDDEIDDENAHQIQPMEDIRSADDAAVKNSGAITDEVATLAAEGAHASALDEPAGSLDHGHPMAIPPSLLDDLDDHATQDAPFEDSQQAAPPAETPSCPVEVPAPFTAGQLDSDIKNSVLEDIQLSYPCLAGTEGSQAIAVASLPETEQSQIVHVNVDIEPADAATAPSGLFDARKDEQEDLEDPASQLASDHGPADLELLSHSKEGQHEACHGSPGRQHKNGTIMVEAHATVQIDAPENTKGTDGPRMDTTNAGGSCQKTEHPVDGSLEDVLPDTEHVEPVAACVQNGADKSLPADESHQADVCPDVGAFVVQEKLPTGAKQVTGSTTPKLRASGMLSQRSQGSLSVTFSDLEMDMETGK